MTTYSASIDRDANRQVIPGPMGLPFKATKRITFAGGTENAIGDHDGTGDPFTIFQVTGDVYVHVFAICRTDLAGAATLEVGVSLNTAEILPQIADVTALDQNEVWYTDGTPVLAKGHTDQRLCVVAGGMDIVGTVGTANITAGVIDFYCFWRPISSDGNVVGD